MSNKSLFEIDREYRDVLKKTCKYVLTFNRGLPLEWQDLYNNFLMDAPKILEEYDASKGISKRTYMQMSCKYHAFNYCRIFKSNKHSPMNESVSTDLEKRYALGEPVSFNNPIDLTKFSELEMAVYVGHFLEGKTIKRMSEELKMSLYKIRNLAKSIKVKIRLQLKN